MLIDDIKGVTISLCCRENLFQARLLQEKPFGTLNVACIETTSQREPELEGYPQAASREVVEMGSLGN